MWQTNGEILYYVSDTMISADLVFFYNFTPMTTCGNTTNTPVQQVYSVVFPQS